MRNALLAIGVLLAACGSEGSERTVTPLSETGEVVPPATNMQVSATLTAATLGDGCGTSSGMGAAPSGDVAGKCAPSNGESGFAPTPGGCGGSICQPSNIQIAFTAGAGTTSAQVEVVSVTLHAETGDAVLDTLTATRPQSWNGSTYVTWDQKLAPSSDLKTSYSLSSPAWSKINPNGTSYSKSYRLRVTLRVDGAELRLESAAVHREPAVAT